MSNGVPCMSVGGETRVACPIRSPLEVFGLAGRPWGCPSTSPARSPTTASTPFFNLPSLCLASSWTRSCPLCRSVSGVKMRVSL